ncbi:hypothetical protein G6F29_012125 [Rhizopus arrhizus]|nr:hypothetical protein G6F30_012070 [Rhizopus arrhizus]KAG0974570.1 hypothetical protein G6F29_012125 [Rhizopus arrhizus]KAG1002243.1 hypothetical protein G6F27_012139 [Rhizopus arrhizus]KAG1017007.1 hypothetical protein G6F26_012074 [Rhizopus arrhizus]KAG1031484.1 hypothetical protein G6F25_012072 [Rhizopus arrhizus]
MSIVNLFVDTSEEKVSTERRFDKGLTISQLKYKLEPITGIPSSTQMIELYQGNNLLGSLDDEDKMLGAYPVEDYMRLHVKDTNPHRVRNQYTDVSLVEKFELTEDEYQKRSDTVRAFKERNKLGRFSDEAAAKEEAIELSYKEAIKNMKIGDRCEVTGDDQSIKRLGTVRYIGETKFQPGLWVGIQYDEPLGKNDGSVQGERYFTCPKNYGGFVRPTKITVGDFPEEDILMSDDDLEEISVFSESDEDELDEFGRVKRRREKFKSERTEDKDYNERSDSDRETHRREDRYHAKRRRRRSSSSSLSPKRSHHRRYSDDSDSDYDRRSKRSSSRQHGYRSSHYHGHHRHHHHSNSRDPYSEAAQYLDTEFYSNKIYIGDLEDVTIEQLEDVFSRFGTLEDVRMVEGKDYAFATYEKKEAALAAIKSMHGVLLGTRQIKVNRAKIPERNKVGFGNIPWQDEDGLMAKDNDDKSRPLPKSLEEKHPINPVASRVLTTYDDL